MIAVAHPRGELLSSLEPREHLIRLEDAYLRSAVLSPAPTLDLSSLDVRDEVHAVADSQNRSDVEDRPIGRWHVLAVDRVGSAAQNYSGRIPVSNPFERSRGRMDLRVHPRLSDAARDELRVLGAVVQYEYPAAHKSIISTCLVSRSSTAAVQRPVSHPQASPGLMSSVLPRVTVSWRCVRPCTTMSCPSIDRLFTSPRSWTRRIRCPLTSKLCGDSYSSVAMPAAPCALRPSWSPSLRPKMPRSGRPASWNGSSANGAQ